MKKFILLFFIVIILLSWCWNEKLSKNELFKKKKECAVLREKMLKDGIEKHEERMNYTGDPYDLKVWEIFYSQKINSCIYILKIGKYMELDEKEWERLYPLNDFMYDYFSKEEIISTVEGQTWFDEKLKELKWE